MLKELVRNDSPTTHLKTECRRTERRQTERCIRPNVEKDPALKERTSKRQNVKLYSTSKNPNVESVCPIGQH